MGGVGSGRPPSVETLVKRFSEQNKPSADVWNAGVLPNLSGVKNEIRNGYANITTDDLVEGSGNKYFTDSNLITSPTFISLSGSVAQNTTNIYSVSGGLIALSGAYNTHATNTSNPHSVTLAQVGGTTDHTALTNIGTNTHAQIDTKLTSLSGVDVKNATNITTVSGALYTLSGANRVDHIVFGGNIYTLNIQMTGTSGATLSNKNNIITLSGGLYALSGAVAQNTANILAVSGSHVALSGAFYNHSARHENGGADLVDHNSLQNYVANEHINWTDTTHTLETTGNVSGAIIYAKNRIQAVNSLNVGGALLDTKVNVSGAFIANRGQLYIDGNNDNAFIVINSTSGAKQTGIRFDQNNSAKWTVSKRPNNDDFAFYTPGQARLYLKSTGEVGIGVADPNYKLDVSGAIVLRNMIEPATPTTSALLFASGGAMYVKGSSGTVTKIANA